MFKKESTNFWDTLARIILRNRILILCLLTLFTLLMISQWKNMKFSFTEANLLPDKHPVNVEYNKFLKVFGEEGNVIVLAIKDKNLYSIDKINAWNNLSKSLSKNKNIENIISLQNLKNLIRNDITKQFDFTPLIKDSIKSSEELIKLKSTINDELPFYKNMVFSENRDAIRSILFLKKAVVNTSKRKDFVLNNLIPKIEKFEKKTGMNVRVSGMPYIRTMNSKNIISEIEIFIIAAVSITSLIFFFFFRSVRATLISMFVVVIGVMWTFGILGALRYEITVLSALIPPVIIVIGVPNCIFLINKYQLEFINHGNKIKSLQRMIAKIGNATLITNSTTALGFATFIITKSKLLTEFGTVASLSIMAVFILSILIIPIIYSYLPQPKEIHLEHLKKKWVKSLGDWIENAVINKNIKIYTTSILLTLFAIAGLSLIKTSGSLLEDMPKNAAFYKDIEFYEKEFKGIMPIEIVIKTNKPGGILRSSALRKMNTLEKVIKEIPQLSEPISVVSIAKYFRQAYWGGDSKYYSLPTKLEGFGMNSYVKRSKSNLSLVKNYVDSTGQYARITTYIKNSGIDQMDQIEGILSDKISELFDNENYEVLITGKAYIFEKGTRFLIKNLVLSLGLAILLISIFMAYMFRSLKMILISLVPNLIPLLITAGIMGFFGVSIKPSTVLVFSIAFGISVDDTIHFLAKYRQELIANSWHTKKSVLNALRETGISMFYTSVVLFFGFSVFITSDYGGTVALGALISGTLLLAMLANLLLLPKLLISLRNGVNN